MAGQKSQQTQRRQPIQARSRETVDAIFEAVARILQAHGRTALTTNAVAERAGISIGTLYSYFPNKDTILLAMARRETLRVKDSVHHALLAAGLPLGEAHIRAAVRALIAGYGRRNRARRILMEALIASGHSDEIAMPVQAIADVIGAMGPGALPPGARPLKPISLFVMTRAVDSIVRAATYEDAAFIATKDFEDEITRLILSFVFWRAD